MDQCHERVYTMSGVEQVALGLYIVRGDNVYDLVGVESWLKYRAVIGEVDDNIDKRIVFADVKADPLKPVVHWLYVIFISSVFTSKVMSLLRFCWWTLWNSIKLFEINLDFCLVF